MDGQRLDAKPAIGFALSFEAVRSNLHSLQILASQRASYAVEGKNLSLLKDQNPDEYRSIINAIKADQRVRIGTALRLRAISVAESKSIRYKDIGSPIDEVLGMRLHAVEDGADFDAHRSEIEADFKSLGPEGTKLYGLFEHGNEYEKRRAKILIAEHYYDASLVGKADSGNPNSIEELLNQLATTS